MGLKYVWKCLINTAGEAKTLKGRRKLLIDANPCILSLEDLMEGLVLYGKCLRFVENMGNIFYRYPYWVCSNFVLFYPFSSTLECINHQKLTKWHVALVLGLKKESKSYLHALKNTAPKEMMAQEMIA